MIVEVIFETVVPIIGRVIGFLFIEILTQTICYTTGFLITRLVTFGKFPKTFVSPKYVTRQQGWLIVIGILFWSVGLIGGALIFVS